MLSQTSALFANLIVSLIVSLIVNCRYCSGFPPGNQETLSIKRLLLGGYGLKGKRSYPSAVLGWEGAI